MTDPHRPTFHFTAPSGWLNDPNGVGQWAGTYHLFYQHNPYRAVHGDIHWGHATSTDLVHWTDEPVALTPSPGPDQDGCWSGVLVDDGGTPTLVYSGNRTGVGQRACRATGDADLRTWTKDPGNPLIPDTPPGLDLTEYRDHSIWREDGAWLHLMGAGVADVGGAALLYRSADLAEWEYVGVFAQGDGRHGSRPTAEPADGGVGPVWTGTVWECPDYSRIDGTDVLTISVWHDGVTHYSTWAAGTREGDTLRLTPFHVLDHGLRFYYAPQSFTDDSGRRIQYGWLQEGRSDAVAETAGWAGVMSLPRELRMVDGHLHAAPVAGVASLRGERFAAGPVVLGQGESVEAPVGGRELDLELDVDLEPGATVELDVLATPDGAERTRVVLDGSGWLRLDRSHSSADPDCDTVALGGAVPVGGARFSVRVLVDRSALEIFVNGQPLTARAYPTRDDATGVRLSCGTGRAAVDRFDVWQMGSIWPGERPAEVLWSR